MSTLSKQELEKSFMLCAILLEVGIAYVVFENLLRKAFPQFGAPILALKFAYFPFLYLVYYGKLRLGFTQFPGRSAVLAYSTWGILVTLVMLPLGFRAAVVAIAVNLLFVPVAFITLANYNSPERIKGVLTRFLILGLVCGAVAVVQSYLAPSHWMNRLMDDSRGLTSGGTLRVSSTFQYCNVYGCFNAAPTIVAFGLCIMAKTSRAQFLYLTAGIAVYAAGTLTGSRVSAIVPLVAILFAMFSEARNNAVNSRIVTVLLLLGSAALIGGVYYSDAVGQWLGRRHFSNVFVSASERFETLYWGTGAKVALGEAKGIGTGWGVYTYGVSRWFPDANISKTYIEGGYVYTLAQTGIIGILLLLYCVFTRGSFFYRSSFPWLSNGIVVWAAIGLFPISFFELPVVAIPWWFLVGIAAVQHERLNERQVGDNPIKRY